MQVNAIVCGSSCKMQMTTSDPGLKGDRLLSFVSRKAHASSHDQTEVDNSYIILNSF